MEFKPTLIINERTETMVKQIFVNHKNEEMNQVKPKYYVVESSILSSTLKYNA